MRRLLNFKVGRIMKRTNLGIAAVSTLLMASTMVSCTGQAFRPRTSMAVVQETDGTKLAAKAEKALADRDFAVALKAAEAAVAANPDNARYRQILGRAYAANGRFASAETTLSDAMTLGNEDARTVVTLALVQVGLGKPEAARALLSAHMDIVPAADYGLAIAMAGDPQEGVRLLSQAIHDPSATARTRQNLAYAYALAGRWKDARVMAGEDLAPMDAMQRITQWAMVAEPSMAPQRVAAFMGVTPDSNDAGLPITLALAPKAGDAARVALAEAAPAAAPSAAWTRAAPVEVTAVEPALMATAAETAPEPALAPAPLIRAERKLVRSIVRAPIATMQRVAYIRPVEKAVSNWVVQVGAYDNAAIAREKWQQMATISSTIAAFPILTSTATVNGRAFYRLALSGFSSRSDAMALCQTIRSQRGQCFVRETTLNAMPQRWALATRGRQFAGR
jgi:Flp pilus assembly protein TadD